MKVFSLVCLILSTIACASASWGQAHSNVPARTQKQVCDVPKQLAVRGGSLLDPLDQGKVMTFKTAMKYKGGLVLETGLLLAVLKGGKELHNSLGDGSLRRATDLGVWFLIIFGSDGIVGLLRKIQVKLGWAAPRQTLVESQNTWYKHIAKPRWTPPNWVFPTVWIPLKLAQVLAAQLVWVAQGRNFTLPVISFVVHQALGDLWNTAFFREHYIQGGMSIILQFFAVLALTTQQFYRVDKLAGLLLIPTNLWLLVASSLNISIWRKNN